MRWIDGLTDNEKERLFNERIKRKEAWHRWFAWYPVTVGEQGKHKIKVWLSFVERKGICFHNYTHILDWYYDYREIKN